MNEDDNGKLGLERINVGPASQTLFQHLTTGCVYYRAQSPVLDTLIIVLIDYLIIVLMYYPSTPDKAYL